MCICRGHPLTLHLSQTKQAALASSLTDSPLPRRHAAFLGIRFSYKALNVGDQNHTYCCKWCLNHGCYTLSTSCPCSSWKRSTGVRLSEHILGIINSARTFLLRPFRHIANDKDIEGFGFRLPGCRSGAQSPFIPVRAAELSSSQAWVHLGVFISQRLKFVPGSWRQVESAPVGLP